MNTLSPTLAYPVCRGSPPAARVAAMIARGVSTRSTLSATPWRCQTGTFFTLAAFAGCEWPHTGTAAAKKRGRWAIACHAPASPNECPVTQTRARSIGSAVSTLSIDSYAR